jgi:hypothetical protein
LTLPGRPAYISSVPFALLDSFAASRQIAVCAGMRPRMNESHNITIPGGEGKPALQYTSQEWEQFQKSDKGAGKSVVLLMGGIFSIGLALYAIVAYVCWFKVM